MKHSYYFPIKGTYYYQADQAFEQGLLTVGTALFLYAEPHNEFDPFALQIWTQPDGKGHLVGYVPRLLAKRWHPHLQLSCTHQGALSSTQPTQIRLTRSVARGKLLRLEGCITLSLGWLHHLYVLAWSAWLRQQQALKGWVWLNQKRKRH